MGSKGADGGVDVVTMIGGAGGQAVARADAVAPRAEPGRASLENPLRPLRRLGVGAALDQGFDLLRYRFRTLVGLAACLYLPIQLLDVVIRLMTSVPDAEGDVAVGPFLSAGAASGWQFLPIVLQTLALSVLGVCVGHLVQRLLDGVDANFRELLTVALRRSWVAVLIVPLAFCIRVPLFCVPLIGWLYADALVFVASIAAGAERLRPIAALGRSIRLARGAIGPAMVLSLGSFCITYIIRISLYTGPAALISIFAPPEGVTILVQQLGSLVLLVVQPLTACIAASSYLLLRSRREGVDLEYRLAERTEVAGAY